MEKRRILILGGGFAGLFTALDLAGSGEVTLVSDENHFLFKPMLYEYFSGEVEEWHIAPNFKELLDESVEVVNGTVSGINLVEQQVSLDENKESLGYDVLVIGLGGITNFVGVHGAEEFSIPFRTIENADSLRSRMVKALDAIPPDLPPQDVRRRLTFAVVGAGASGVELSTKMADLLSDAFQRRNLQGTPRVLLVEMGNRVVPGMGEELREFVENALNEAGIEVHTETRVVSVGENSITFDHNGVQDQIETAAVVWTGGVRMSPVIEQLDVDKTSHGLLKIKPTFQLVKYPNVLALGDVAFYPDIAPTLAGTAQLALQEARLAARNVQALLAGEELKTAHFEELGELLSLGTEQAAVLLAGKVVGGPLARQARFALYTARLPTWHHRLRVGASWFFEGTAPRPLLPLGFER
jgi:NADH:ubiquinone reductase (non-electrogenic)